MVFVPRFRELDECMHCGKQEVAHCYTGICCIKCPNGREIAINADNSEPKDKATLFEPLFVLENYEELETSGYSVKGGGN